MRHGVGVVMVTVIGLGMLAVCGMPVSAGEHGGSEHGGTSVSEGSSEHGGVKLGSEHGGKEHGGTASSVITETPQEPSAQAIRDTIQDYVTQITEDQGNFTIEDSETGTTRELQLVLVHERVGKTGSLYYSCTDMRDAANGELLDLDFDVDVSDGDSNVVDVRIHKVDGQARYTYDDDNNRISLL